LIVNASPAIVSVPDRGAPVVFAWTVNCTTPSPAPDVALVIVTHAALLAAVHEHPAPALTLTKPLPPAFPIGCDEALSAYVHPDSCATDTLRPATVSVVLRAGPTFTPMFSTTAPLPVPLDPDVTVTQPTALAAVHVQAGAVTTSRPDDPPAADFDTLSGVTV
jgi:hypothetical protein